MRRWWVFGLGLAWFGCGFDSGGNALADDVGDSGSSGSSSGGASMSSTTSAGVTTGNDPDSGTTATTSSSSTTSTGDDSESSGDPSGSTTGLEADCSTNNGGCDPNAACADDTGTVVCTCNLGYEGDGVDCAVDAALQTVRVEVGCTGAPGCNPAYCIIDETAQDAETMTGNPEVTYDVTLRLRGVIEQKTYLGGTTQGFWNEGGSPQSDDWNIYVLDISSPAQTYYVNAGSSGNPYCDPMDYERTVPIQGGATVQLRMPANGLCSTRNVDSQGTPIVIDNVPPAPASFNGQFIQIDATNILPP